MAPKLPDPVFTAEQLREMYGIRCTRCRVELTVREELYHPDLCYTCFQLFRTDISPLDKQGKPNG
jgi:hypothetical protein